ncbi:unnamed protein product [Spirodela intermedia]|uniref:Uncharacterized protein n=2 Tax=Spirodela intermedia TaxID=51605 RepID=A0A7I8KKJ0_SPIIN|nr:unnamed protein product [Spirodela intermedia]CAA6661247.1 unnamed protein product [Spirodela intermedia]CAA7397608.1 unnamed protein product [Spirodela intermedia]
MQKANRHIMRHGSYVQFSCEVFFVDGFYCDQI